MKSYSPVPYDYREIAADAIQNGKEGKVFFFSDDDQVEASEGKIIAMDEIPGKGIFVTLEPFAQIRIDRVITLFGKPGAAYDEYDRFANSCMDCTGGYDPDKLP